MNDFVNHQEGALTKIYFFCLFLNPHALFKILFIPVNNLKSFLFLNMNFLNISTFLVVSCSFEKGQGHKDSGVLTVTFINLPQNHQTTAFFRTCPEACTPMKLEGIKKLREKERFLASVFQHRWITSTRLTQSAICSYLILAEPSLPNAGVTLRLRPPGGSPIWLLRTTGALP